MTLNILDIIRGTTVDGPGFRTSIYIAGCDHHCPGCHNPQSWNPKAGIPMTLDEIMEIIKEEDFNVTLTGGDPLRNPDSVVPLLKRIREEDYTIWLYTGFTYEEILADEKKRSVLPYLEAIVEGKFIEALRDTDLQFRGSANQRIIYL